MGDEQFFLGVSKRDGGRMRFLIQAGKVTSAGGGLSQMSAQEALIVARELRRHGIDDVQIYNVETCTPTTEGELAQLLPRRRQTVVPKKREPFRA